MSTIYRPNRKVEDADIVRMNSVGLSLGTIARTFDCHPTTITLRLKSLKIPPADTRRAFMEDIYLSLSMDQQEWLSDQVQADFSVKDFVRKLLIQEFAKSKSNKWNHTNAQSS